MKVTEYVSPTLDRIAFGIKETAQRLGVSSAFLRLEISRGNLNTIRLGRRVLITGPELERYLNAGKEETNDLG